jgi:hypothetical protein
MTNSNPPITHGALATLQSAQPPGQGHDGPSGSVGQQGQSGPRGSTGFAEVETGLLLLGFSVLEAADLARFTQCGQSDAEGVGAGSTWSLVVFDAF